MPCPWAPGLDAREPALCLRPPLISGSPAGGFVPGARLLCRPFVQAWAEALSPPRPRLALGLFFLWGVLAFVLTLCFWPFG